MKHAARVLPMLIAGAAVACTTRGPAQRPSGESFPFDKPAYYNEGKLLMIGLGVRASRLAGPAEYLPVEIVIANKDKREIVLGREAFSLELPDRTLVPLAAYRAFRDGYSRAAADARIGQAFFESIGGRFPIPPFHWLSLDFFPLKTSNVVPRESLELRFGDVGFGYLYFHLPPPPPSRGVYKLLVAPRGVENPYVVDFAPYRKKKSRQP